MNLYHSFPRMTQLLVQSMPRNMIFLTQQDGNTSKDMPRFPKDSSELSNNPGVAKLEYQLDINDRIPSTTPGADPPRDARDSGSARSHSTHLETSSSDRPKWSPTRSSTRYQDQLSVNFTRRTLRMPSFRRAAHAQPSLSNIPRRDSNFGERTRSRGTTLGERNFPTSPQNKKTKLTHCSIYVPMRTISTSHTKRTSCSP